MVRSAALLLALFAAVQASASNNISVERRAIRFGETLGITVSLEDDFAELDHVRIPLRNLTIADPPSIASEFSWINGDVVRRKVLRYRARAVAPGPALVGPIVLRIGDQRDTLPAIAIDVIPDRAALSNDPEVILGELLATEREPLFVVAEAETLVAHVGEQVIVTWYLYNGSAVQQWQIGSIPDLEDFWVEELDVRSSRPATVPVAGHMLQKMPVRRAALYPLRSGRHEVGAMEIEAAVMRRTSRGPFSMFEGNLVEIGASSVPFHIEARPLPAGPAVAAVGTFNIQCTAPSQVNAGPVVMEAVVRGRGNLRAAAPPQFITDPAGEVQRIDHGVSVTQTADTAWMTRRWQFVIFPRESGSMTIPPMRMRIFSTETDSRENLQCPAATLMVEASARPRLATTPPAVARQETRLPVMIAAAIGIACLLFVLPWWRRRAALNRDIRMMMVSAEPPQVRERVHATLEKRGIDPRVLVREASDRGDAYRSLRSLLDALEKDRIDVGDRTREIRRRIRELLG